MGRFLGVVAVILLAGLIPGCSHSQSVTTTTVTTVPASISLTPTPSASLEIGKTLSFTATPKDSSSSTITETVTYQSSNPTVLTITTAGLACAGSWDNLATPQVCTPGPAGVAQVTATVAGVSSPPTSVYVHQHIDNISVSPAPNQAPLTADCISSGQSFNYQAIASSRGVDVTSTVGPFNWASTTSGVVILTASTLTAPINGLPPGQVIAKANVPGQTMIFASINGVTSVPLQFNTCAVEAITLEIDGAPPGPFTVPSGTTHTITPLIHDTLGNLISGSFLTWTSSNLSSVTVSAGAVTTPQRGGATVIASCTPPTCNIGITPALPIYPENAVQFLVGQAAGSTSTTTASTAWVSTTGCKGSDGCVSEINSIAVSGSSATAPTIGTPVTLPGTPNSMVMDRQGLRIFLGTDSGALGTKGLMVFAVSGTTVNQFVSTPGKVLAVSPDGTKAIVSDTVDTPNQVYVFDTAGNTSVAYSITGATAADFSPDSLKAYIIAGSTLYVYSKLDALQTISLAGAPTGVAFSAQGGFAYVAGEPASAVTVRKTCDNTVAFSFPQPPTPATQQILPLPATPIFIQNVPNSAAIALDSTGLDLITATAMDPLDLAVSNNGAFVESTTGTELRGCSPPTGPVPSGLPAILNTVTTFNLGQGTFVPTQLIVSSNGLTAYVLTQNSGRILVFDVNQRTVSSMQLVNSAAALHAALSADGGTLYVGASDNTVHLLDTLTGTDTAQLSFPQDINALQTGLCGNVSFTCLPDLIVTKP